MNNVYDYAMSTFLSTSGFKQIDPKEFDFKLIEVDLEYPKELHELHNDYSLAPDKIEIKRKMLSSYQLKIADFCNIYILEYIYQNSINHNG